MIDFLYISKPRIELLKEIQNQKLKLPIRRLGRGAYLQYGSKLKSINIFQKLGLVTTIKKERSIYTTITPKGIKILNHLNQIESLLGTKTPLVKLEEMRV